MRIGAVFPQNDIGSDPGGVRAYAQGVEEMGFAHILAFDHVLGADVSAPGRQPWPGPYTHEHLFHEIMVLFGYLACATSKVELVSGIVILPQRQTALVAKQAAEVDVLSNGRLRLGIGIGWNPVEFEGLNEDFHTRGKRSAEQVELLRELWTKPLVDFRGEYHTIVAAGLNPLPVQRPIPIWFGGHAEPVMRRAARLGDGWIPVRLPRGNEGDAAVAHFRELVAEAGRDPAKIGMESWVNIAQRSEDQWREDAEMWKRRGATHLSVNTMGCGYTKADQHLDAVRRFKAVAEGL